MSYDYTGSIFKPRSKFKKILDRASRRIFLTADAGYWSSSYV